MLARFYAYVKLPITGLLPERPFTLINTQDAPGPPLRPPVGCSYLLLLIRLLRRWPSPLAWRPIFFVILPRHAITQVNDEHTQPRSTGLADVSTGAPRFTHEVWATNNHTSIVTAVHSSSNRAPLSRALVPVPHPLPFSIPRVRVAVSPPEHPVTAHLCIHAYLLIFLFSLPPPLETVDVPAELVANIVSRTPTISLLPDQARLLRGVNAFAKPGINITSKAATPSPAWLIHFPNALGRVDVHAEIDTTALSRTPTSPRRVRSGSPLDVVGVVPNLGVTINSATPIPSTESLLSFSSPAEVDVAAKIVGERRYATPTSCGSAISIIFHAVATDEVGVPAKIDISTTSRTSTLSPQLPCGHVSFSWAPSSCVFLSCAPSFASCPPWDEALARAVLQFFTSVGGQAGSLPRRSRSIVGRCRAQAPASPLCSAGHVHCERSPVPSVEPFDLGPEVPIPYAPTLRPAASCRSVRRDAARGNVIATHGGSSRPVGGVSSAAMVDVEGAVAAVGPLQPRRSNMAIALTTKKPSAVLVATALLTALLSPSTSLSHPSYRSSQHEWTIATVVMSIVVQPGVGTHTPTATGAKTACHRVQACDAGEAVDGTRVALIAPLCVWSTCACLQPSLPTAAARVPAWSPCVVCAVATLLRAWHRGGSLITSTRRAPASRDHAARALLGTFP